MITIAGLIGAVAVAGAALGEHRLVADPGAAALARVGSEFALFHALALLALAALAQSPAARLVKWAALFFIVGTVLFSGSLFALAFAGVGLPGLAPVGGICLILGWLAVAGSGIRAGRRPWKA